MKDIGMLHQIPMQSTEQKEPFLLAGHGGKDHTLCVCGAQNFCPCKQVSNQFPCHGFPLDTFSSGATIWKCSNIEDTCTGHELAAYMAISMQVPVQVKGVRFQSALW